MLLTITKRLTGTVGSLMNNIFDYIDELLGKLDKVSTPDIDYPANEKEKYETLLEYIVNNVNIDDLKNTIFRLLNITSCEEFLKWAVSKLKELKAKIAGSTNSIDSMLEKFKKRFPILRIIDELLNGKFSLSTILKIVRALLELILMMFAGIVIDIMDKIYETYRYLKVFVGLELVIFESIKDTNLLKNCKCNNNCELTSLVGLGGCPVKVIINLLSTLSNMVATGVDTATLPVDVAMLSLDTILTNDLVRLICPRKYPAVKVSDVMLIILELSLYGSNICTSPSKTVSRKPLTSALFGATRLTLTNIRNLVTSGVNSNIPMISGFDGCASEVIKKDLLDGKDPSLIVKDKFNSMTASKEVGRLSLEEIFNKLDELAKNDLETFVDMYKSGELDILINAIKSGKLDQINQLGMKVIDTAEFRKIVNELSSINTTSSFMGTYLSLMWHYMYGDFYELDNLIKLGYINQILLWLEKLKTK